MWRLPFGRPQAISLPRGRPSAQRPQTTRRQPRHLSRTSAMRRRSYAELHISSSCGLMRQRSCRSCTGALAPPTTLTFLRAPAQRRTPWLPSHPPRRTRASPYWGTRGHRPVLLAVLGSGSTNERRRPAAALHRYSVPASMPASQMRCTHPFRINRGHTNTRSRRPPRGTAPRWMRCRCPRRREPRSSSGSATASTVESPPLARRPPPHARRGPRPIDCCCPSTERAHATD
jgi:hypothetical protein